MSTGADRQSIPQGTHSQPPSLHLPPTSSWCQQHSCVLAAVYIKYRGTWIRQNRNIASHSQLGEYFLLWAWAKYVLIFIFLKDNLTILRENNILQLLFPAKLWFWKKIIKNHKSFVVGTGSCFDHRMMWCDVMTSFPCVDFWTLELHLNTKT